MKCKTCGQEVAAHPLAQLYQHVIGHVRSIDTQRKEWQQEAADTEEEQRRRLEIAQSEMAAAEQFDHVVENQPGELEAAARRVHEILAEEKRARSKA